MSFLNSRTCVILPKNIDFVGDTDDLCVFERASTEEPFKTKYWGKELRILTPTGEELVLPREYSNQSDSLIPELLKPAKKEYAVFKHYSDSYAILRRHFKEWTVTAPNGKSFTFYMIKLVIPFWSNLGVESEAAHTVFDSIAIHLRGDDKFFFNFNINEEKCSVEVDESKESRYVPWNQENMEKHTSSFVCAYAWARRKMADDDEDARVAFHRKWASRPYRRGNPKCAFRKKEFQRAKEEIKATFEHLATLDKPVMLKLSSHSRAYRLAKEKK